MGRWRENEWMNFEAVEPCNEALCSCLETFDGPYSWCPHQFLSTTLIWTNSLVILCGMLRSFLVTVTNIWQEIKEGFWGSQFEGALYRGGEGMVARGSLLESGVWSWEPYSFTFWQNRKQRGTKNVSRYKISSPAPSDGLPPEESYCFPEEPRFLQRSPCFLQRSPTSSRGAPVPKGFTTL